MSLRDKTLFDTGFPFEDLSGSMEGPKSEPPIIDTSAILAALEEARRKAGEAVTDAKLQPYDFALKPIKGGTDLGTALDQMRSMYDTDPFGIPSSIPKTIGGMEADAYWALCRAEADRKAAEEGLYYDGLEADRLRREEEAMLNLMPHEPPKEIFLNILPTTNYFDDKPIQNIIPLPDPNEKLDPPFILDHDKFGLNEMGPKDADNDPFGLRALLARERGTRAEPTFDAKYLEDRLDGKPRLDATIDLISRMLDREHGGIDSDTLDDDGPYRLDF